MPKMAAKGGISMDEIDLQLIEQHSKENSTLDKLYKEHIKLELKLDKINNKRCLSPQETLNRKALQKEKLLGRDKIEQILVKYR